MHERAHYSMTALSYANALLELADESKTPPEAIAADLDGLRSLVGSDANFQLYLRDPSISKEGRWTVLRKVLQAQVSPLLLQFMGVLNEKNRLGLLTQIADAFDAILDEKLGKVEVDLIVAHKLSPDELRDATQRITQALKREAVVHPYVDESIIGGMILRVGDKLIDASVKNQLHAIKEKLLASKPK
ncbi:MAG: ATP synthase F1 subunit delta [Anaerolineae bacterium]|nr:ATP synthase F1 subunit delta [Phycisphaerae bacterium]